MTSHPGSDRRPDGLAGFTLAELLTVLAILSMVGALGAGAFQLARRQYALTASAASVAGVIRAARNAAISSGVTARVVADPIEGEVTSYGFETVGEWDFEREEDGASLGARNAPASLRDGAARGKGYRGSGLRIGGPAHADCGSLSAYDLRAGVYAEAWIRWDAPDGPAPANMSVRVGSGRVSGTKKRSASTAPGRTRVAPVDEADAILMRGPAFFLGLGRDGSLEGRIGEYGVRSVPGVVVPGRWTHVALWFDGEGVLLLADGIERVTQLADGSDLEASTSTGRREKLSIPGTKEPFTIGGSRSFSGDIDEVRLHGLIEPVRHTLGSNEKLVGWRKVIRFDRRGRLHPRYHETALRVILAAVEEEPAATSTRTQVLPDWSLTYVEWARRGGLVPIEGGEEAEEERQLAKLGGARRIILTVDTSGTVK